MDFLVRSLGWLRERLGERRNVPRGLINGQVAEALLRNRTIALLTPINDQVANDVIARLLFLQRESAELPIDLRINSPGGAVLEGLAIIDAMDELRPSVRTHCERFAGSLAAVVLINGRRGERTADPEATLMLSMPTSDRPEQREEAERLGSILIWQVVRATGLPPKRVREFCEASTTFTAHEAKALGLIDRVERRGVSNAQDFPD